MLLSKALSFSPTSNRKPDSQKEHTDLPQTHFPPAVPNPKLTLLGTGICTNHYLGQSNPRPMPISLLGDRPAFVRASQLLRWTFSDHDCPQTDRVPPLFLINSPCSTPHGGCLLRTGYPPFFRQTSGTRACRSTALTPLVRFVVPTRGGDRGFSVPPWDPDPPILSSGAINGFFSIPLESQDYLGVRF